MAVLSISTILVSAPSVNGALPQMRDSLHVTQAQVEALSTMPNLTAVVFILLSSFVAAKIGLKKTVTIGLVLTCLGGCMPVFISDYPLLVASRLVLGAGLGLFNSLAVSVISTLYHGYTRAGMLGIRNSTENIGQAVLTFVAGLLLDIGWHFTFLIYLLAIPLMFVFDIMVPDPQKVEEGKRKPPARIEKKAKDFARIEEETWASDNNSIQAGTQSEGKDRLHPIVYFLFVLCMILTMNGFAVLVRFPSIAVAIKGKTYNPSTLLSLMPILGIIAGFLFGIVHQYLKSNTIYVGMILYALVNLLLGFSSDNFAVLLVGLFLSGVPNAWCFPYIYNLLGEVCKTGKALNFATALMLVGCNVGAFLAPYAMQVIQVLSGGGNLQVPFPIFAVLDLMLLAALALINRRMLGSAAKEPENVGDDN
nr:MFS transporter [Bifidobacterium sp. ESL0784]